MWLPVTVYVGIFVTAFSVWIVAVIVLLAKSFRSHPLLPDRWTRGFTRWRTRCTRWAHRLGTEPHRTTQRECEIVPVTYMQTTPQDVPAAWNDRPTPEEFAAAPPLDHGTVDRLLRDLGEAP